MSNPIQYTIRGITPAADARLKAQAKKQGISLNKLLLVKLGSISKPDNSKKVHNDLDWLFGSMPAEEAAELDRIIMEERKIARARAQADYEAEKARGI